MNSRKQKNKTVRRKPRNRNGSRNSPDSFRSSEQTTIIKAPGGQSASMLVPLRYCDETGTFSSGASFGAFNTNLNNTFDKAGALFTENLLLYTVYSKLYSFNLVKRVRQSFTFSNQCDFAVEVVVIPSNTSPIVPLTSNDVRDRVEASFSKRATMSPKYGKNDIVKITVDLEIHRIYGNPLEYVGSGLYSCTTGSAPSVNYYNNVLFYSPNGVSISAGIDYVYVETDYVLFYAPAQVTDATLRNHLELPPLARLQVPVATVKPVSSDQADRRLARFK
jgi:hypothetical protein